MKELNKDKLIEGLQRLPEYQAPDFVWDKINSELKKDPALYKALRDLPEHKAPNHVWNSIERALEPKGRIFNLSNLRKIAAAAAILILVSIGFNTIEKSVTEDPFDLLAVTVSEEQVDNKVLNLSNNEDQDAIDDLLVLCSNMEFICTRPRVSKLKNDLLELSEAKKLLKKALGEFGTEVYLIKQLKNIEIEQGILIKELTKQLT